MDREDYIAAAWNAAYESAHPPHTAFDKAQAAGKIAADEWDKRHTAQFACVARAPMGSMMVVEVFATEAEADEKCRKMREKNPKWEFATDPVAKET